MSEEFQCNDANRGLLVERYSLGGMSKKERRAFDTHLQTCKFCARRLKENQKIVNKLKGAAKDAGWSEKDISEIDHLYARAGLSRGINWVLILKITVILMVLVILPFTWWANRPATKMALMVSLSREVVLAPVDASLQPAHELHVHGKDKEAIAELKQWVASNADAATNATAERLLGLSFLFIEMPDSALSHLQMSLAESAGEAEQRSYFYIAQAHLMMGNKLGALAALKSASSSEASVPEVVSQQLAQLEAL